jgi:hypothetical protein
MMQSNELMAVLTVFGFGSSIRWIKDLAPGENQSGHEK